MIQLLRSAIVFLLLLAAATMLSACDDDGDPDGSGSSPTPFIAPEALATTQALALLDEIETLVRAPNRTLIALARLSEAQAQERSGRILNGVDDVSGLDDVRGSLESGDRVGAGEYLFNVFRDDTEPFGEFDTSEIGDEALNEIDLFNTFDQDHSDGMIVSSLYRDAVIKMMQLWYGLVGEPPEDTPAPS